ALDLHKKNKIKNIWIFKSSDKYIPENQHKDINPKKIKKLQKFKNTLCKKHTAVFYDNLDDLRAKIITECFRSLSGQFTTLPSQELIPLSPTTASGVFNNTGNVLAQLGRYDEAISWYDKALDLEPKSVGTLSNKGVTFAQQGRYDEAISWYDKALGVESTFSPALLGKGNALVKLSRFDEALEYYDKNLEINPKDVKTWYNKGCALMYMK